MSVKELAAVVHLKRKLKHLMFLKILVSFSKLQIGNIDIFIFIGWQKYYQKNSLMIPGTGILKDGNL